MKTVLLDNGHGGLINGKYQTPGKRSPIWDDGSQLFEGEFNRAIVARIIEGLTTLGIPYVNICPEHDDMALSTRTRRANKFYDEVSKDCFYMSIHSNAGGGHGSEVFTSPGDTKSDQIATCFGEIYKVFYPNLRLRTDFSDGDLDKEANFYVLKRTKMPAILTENFFMDNEAECKEFLMSKKSRDTIAFIHIDTIIRTVS
mgnify:CR=1 FL=1